MASTYHVFNLGDFFPIDPTSKREAMRLCAELARQARSRGIKLTGNALDGYRDKYGDCAIDFERCEIDHDEESID